MLRGFGNFLFPAGHLTLAIAIAACLSVWPWEQNRLADTAKVDAMFHV